MRQLLRQTLVVVALVLLSQAYSWGAVTVNWDGGSLDLSLIANPDAAVESWLPEIWYGEISIPFTSLDSVVFTGSGSFKNGAGTVVEYVRLKQTLTNNTNSVWTDFHIRLDGATFYKMWLLQGGWNVSQSDFAFDYYANPQYAVAPESKFSDGIVFVVSTDENGDGTFTLTKWPTAPEPASALALLIGITGLAAYIGRRKM